MHKLVALLGVLWLGGWQGVCAQSAWQSVGVSTQNWEYVYEMAHSPTGEIYAILGKAVYRWDGQVWAMLPATGVNSTLNALAVDDLGNVYVSGYFWEPTERRYFYLARLEGGKWRPLGPASGDLVIAPCNIQTGKNGTVYAFWWNPNDNVEQYIAKWDGNAWSKIPLAEFPLGIGNLAEDTDGSIFVVGGLFNGEYYMAARWDGTKWAALGARPTSAMYVYGSLAGIAKDREGHWVVSGKSSPWGNSYAYFARWTGSVWSGQEVKPLDGQSSIYSNECIEDRKGNIYLTSLHSDSAHRSFLLRWDGTSLSRVYFTQNPKSLNSAIFDLAFDQHNTMYLCGGIYLPNGRGSLIAMLDSTGVYKPIVAENAINARMGLEAVGLDPQGNVCVVTSYMNDHHFVARWQHDAWKDIYNPAKPLSYYGEAITQAMTFAPDGSLYIVRNHYNNDRSMVVHWDGESWTNLPTPKTKWYARDLLAIGTKLYLTEQYPDSTGRSAIKEWDGTQWRSLPLIGDGNALALMADSAGMLYAAGDLHIGGKYGVYRWDGGTWTEVGHLNGNAAINTLAMDSKGQIYAAGRFTTGTTSEDGRPYVARWNGSTWKELDNDNRPFKRYGMEFYSLYVDRHDNLYVTTYDKIARWNGSEWLSAPPMEGMNWCQYHTIAVDSADILYAVGGSPEGRGYYGVYQIPTDSLNQQQAFVDPAGTGTGGWLKVSPNPTTDGVYVASGEGINQTQCTVYNLLGEVVLTQPVADPVRFWLDLSPCVPGIYILRFGAGSALIQKY